MTAGQILSFVYDSAWCRAALLLMCADVLSGIALALYTREFRLARIGDFLITRAIPYFLGAGVVELVVLASPDDTLGGLTYTVASGAWLFAVLALVGHVIGNLRQMGIPLPAVLGDAPAPKATDPTPRPPS